MGASLHALIRPATANLRSRWLPHSLIFLVIAATSAMLTLALVVYRSAVLAFDRTFARANGAHVWFAASDAEVLLSLGRLPGVAQANTPFPAAWGSFSLAAAGETDPLALWGLPADGLAVGQPVVVAGRWLRSSDTGALVLDQGLARLRGLQPGDEVELQTAAGMTTLTVVGLATNPARPAYPASSPALGYVLAETLARLEPDRARWGWLLGIRLSATEETSSFIELARRAYLPGAAISATPWQWVRDEVRDSTYFNVLFLGVFGAFALLAASLVVGNLVGGQVAAQLRTIGLLKAIGLTPGQVTALLVAEQTALGLLAIAAGTMLGVNLARPLLISTAAILGAAPSPAAEPALLTVLVVALTLAIALMALVPAWRGGRVVTVQALTAGVAAAPVHASGLAGTAARAGLPVVAVLGLKQALQSRSRAALTVGSAALAMATATFTLSAEATLQAALRDPAVIGGPPYSLEAWRVNFATGRATLPVTEAEQLLADHPGVTGALSFVNVAVRLLPQPGQPEATGFMSFAVGGDLERFRFHIPEGRMFAGPGEAILSGALVDELGLQLGDTLTLRILQAANGVLVDGEQTLTVRYVGRYVASGDGGRRLLYSLETYQQQIDPHAEPERYGLQLAPGADVQAVRADLERASSGRLDLVVNDPRPGVEAVRGVLWALTAGLVGIAAINLLATLWLGVRERRPELALLKTTGLTPTQVAASVLVGSTALATASAVGVPAGLMVTRLLFDLISVAINLGRGVFALPHPLWLMGLVPLVVLVAALGAALPARLAAEVRVVEALRVD